MTKITDYAHILRAIADGEEVQQKGPYSDDSWMDQDTDTVLREIANCERPPERYRIKPKTILINGIALKSEPMRLAPPVGSWYWLVQPLIPEGYDQYCWEDSHIEHLWLSRGLIHTTQEAAATHSRALASFTSKEQQS